MHSIGDDTVLTLRNKSLCIKCIIVPLQSRWWSGRAAAPYERSRKLHQTQRGLLVPWDWPVAGEYKRRETTCQSALSRTTNSFRLYQGNTMSYNKVSSITTVLGNMLTWMGIKSFNCVSPLYLTHANRSGPNGWLCCIADKNHKAI